jgi:hypothetical protein
MRIVMSPEPFGRHLRQGRIGPDQDVLVRGWQDGMGTGRDRKPHARRRFGRAALQKEQNGEKAKHPGSYMDGSHVLRRSALGLRVIAIHPFHIFREPVGIPCPLLILGKLNRLFGFFQAGVFLDLVDDGPSEVFEIAAE